MVIEGVIYVYGFGNSNGRVGGPMKGLRPATNYDEVCGNTGGQV